MNIVRLLSALQEDLSMSRYLPQRQRSKQTGICTEVGSLRLKLKRFREITRLALVVTVVSAVVLPLKALAITCPITNLVTVSTADTNSVSCDITETGQLDIQDQGGALSNLPGGSLNNDGLLTVSGSLTNQFGGEVDNYSSIETGQVDGDIINYGLIGNRSDAVLEVHGSFTNMPSGIIRNSGKLIKGCCATFKNHGELWNWSSAKLILYNCYCLTPINDGMIHNEGTIDFVAFDNNEGGTIINDGAIKAFIALYNYGTVNNRQDGDLTLGDSYLLNIGTLTNDGTLTIIGTLRGNLESSTIIQNKGTLNNNGTLTITGVTSEGIPDIPTLENNGTLNNTGTLVNEGEGILDNKGILNNDGSITNSSDISNTGNFYITNTGTVTGSGGFIQSEGSTLADGDLNQASITFTGGTLGGHGVITSNSIPVDIATGVSINPGNSASVSPSDFTGTLTFGSDVSFDGAMTIELAGLADFDFIEVSGAVNFGSQAVITFDLQGYAPRAGDSFMFLNADTLTGFSNINYEFDLPYWLDHTVSLSPENTLTVTVTAVPPDPDNDGRIDLSGIIKTAEGDNVCAMVLASGQFMFSCNPIGVFSVTDLPRENDGTVKRQIYADGFFPKINTMLESSNAAVFMTRSGTCPNYNTPYEPAFVPGSAGKRINLAGKVLLQNSQTPICAMVLANGQHTFSCSGTGSYALDIPLDTNGQFKLQVYADGFAPMIQRFDELSPTNDVRMARATECQ